MTRRWTLLASLLLSVTLLSPSPAGAGLSKDLVERLGEATYVYIASTRKDGTLGRPAEIWFFYDTGAVYVGTPTKSWRVRRIKAGRPQAKIWIGEPNGPRRTTVTEREIQMLPSFKAKGEIVNDRKMHARLHARLRRGSVVLADNIFLFRRALAPYVAHVQEPRNGFSSVTLFRGSGTEYSLRR